METTVSTRAVSAGPAAAAEEINSQRTKATAAAAAAAEKKWEWENDIGVPADRARADEKLVKANEEAMIWDAAATDTERSKEAALEKALTAIEELRNPPSHTSAIRREFAASGTKPNEPTITPLGLREDAKVATAYNKGPFAARRPGPRGSSDWGGRRTKRRPKKGKNNRTKKGKNKSTKRKTKRRIKRRKRNNKSKK